MLESRRVRGLAVVALAMALLCLTGVADAAAAAITEFEVEPGAAAGSIEPRYLTAGPDGQLWYTVVGALTGIGRIGPSGERFPLIAEPNAPLDLVFGGDGTLYWTADRGYGRRLPNGTLETRTLEKAPSYGLTLGGDGLLVTGWVNNFGPSTSEVCRHSSSNFKDTDITCGEYGNEGRITDLLTAPDGTLWAAFPESGVVRHISADTLTALQKIELPSGSEPSRMTFGPEGNIWVTLFGSSAIERITPGGGLKSFPLKAGSDPNDIVLGPDGALWITDFGTSNIARMNTAGAVTNEYPTPTPNSRPAGIAVGPEGNIWFTEQGAGKIARLVPGGPAEGGPGAGGSKPGAPKFTQKPSFSPARFAVAGGAGASAAHGGKKAPRGTKLDLGLSEAATVTATISRPAPGRKRGKKCVAPGAAPKGAAKCRRYVVKGKVTWSAAAGTDKLPFSGRVHGKALKPGSYRAAVVARDSSGAVSEEKLATFTVVVG